MPIVEAMASGVPCVVSSHPSMDEACGDAAVRVDPESPEAIARRDRAGARRARARSSPRGSTTRAGSPGSRAARRCSPRTRRRRDPRRARRLAAAPDPRRHRARDRGPARPADAGDRAASSSPSAAPAGSGRSSSTRLVPARSCRGGARGLDVLHCPTYRAPAGGPVPVVMTVHDLAVFRFPEAFGRWTRRLQPPRRPAGGARRAARDRGLGVHEARGGRAARRRRGEGPRRPERRRAGVPSRGRGGAGRLRARGRHASSRARTCPRLAEAARRLGVELRVAGARGWGDVPLERRHAARRGLRRGARPPLPRRPLPRLSVAVRGLRDPGARGDGLRHARRDERPRRAPRRRRAARPCSSTRSTPRRSRPGSRRPAARREELRALGLERARGFTWERAAALTAEAYREAAA